ncbi:hypothetical protein AX17_000581 [Amanita inopinata Kibby_2008]|nr:hypothetical protein AX17_000581 [Amanita inopinata Kibby_2008]
MEKNLNNKIEDFRKSITSVGEEIVFATFPQKILELSQLLETTSNAESPFHISHAQSSTDPTVYPPTQTASDGPLIKKRKLNGTEEIEDGAARSHGSITNDIQYATLPSRVSTNYHISKVHEVVKKECEKLVQLTAYAYNTDRGPDTRRFVPSFMAGLRVDDAKEVLGELHRAQESAYNLRDAARQDYLSRAKICSKLVKYPNVEDYTVCPIS